jgi:capsular exopolysaccharide synthesis family protein
MARKKDNHVRQNTGLITLALPSSVISEQFRTLRTNIQFSMVDNNLKELSIVSAAPNAGKSTVSANLAVTFASQGTRVLIADCDFRRPTVHKNFSLPNVQGMTTLLTDKTGSIEDYIQTTRMENLFVMTSGPIPPNPAELLSSKRMIQLEKELGDMFDLVIYDTPPLLGFADAQIIAGRVDGVIFVVNHGVATKDDVLRASESLKMVNANVLGAVYNRVPINGSDNSYYYYYEQEN